MVPNSLRTLQHTSILCLTFPMSKAGILQVFLDHKVRKLENQGLQCYMPQERLLSERGSTSSPGGLRIIIGLNFLKI